ncbi:MAG TPA: BACON domain-containing carbohydrate-binding protein [Vicinamibacterales bacterium]|nr:BACON domain-containing carbohydrate-binding protein [Vicinamibacterales bacterium]
MAAAGGTGSLTVSTARECTWSASSDASWLTITAGASGQGDGTVQYSAAGNPAPSTRRASVIVGEARAELTQAAAPCEFAVTPASFTFESGGGDGAVTVQTLEGCRWSAASAVPWISITGTQNLNGSGSASFHIDSNPGDPRNATFVVAGQTIQISQGAASAPCTYALEPASATVEASGGTTQFSIATRTGCGWAAVTHVPWVNVTSSPAGSGNGTVTLLITANSGAARIGTVTIQGQTFTVTQAAAATPCAYSIAPASFDAPVAGSPTTVTVTALGGCVWTATSQAPWIVVSGGGTGNGNGTVTLMIAANTGAARSGTVSIAGQTFTVNQAGVSSPCLYSIAPASFAAPATAATTAVDVTAQAGCGWTAATDASWISITSGASGSGSGRVALAIAANTGGERSATVTIAGQAFTVTQAAAPSPCTYAIAPQTFTVAATGGTTATDVTTQAGCAWTAVSQVPWITVTAGASGNGNGHVEMAILANVGASRTGTVIIGTQTFTVTQDAVVTVCTYTLNPTTQTVPVNGGDFTVTVTTQPLCAWTATSSAEWLTIRDQASGIGTGVVTYRLAPNVQSSAPRTATVTIGGQVLTVTQEGRTAVNEP